MKQKESREKKRVRERCFKKRRGEREPRKTGDRERKGRRVKGLKANLSVRSLLSSLLQYLKINLICL